ncbi:LuxR family transcriptional regulator [Nonomuraea mesophila]|uniref:LuxR family transcriptional regulator n=1 Tax=Nonomuraea mesophila TaxID=2530382 RepID=A0A4R5FWS4_9ACTN|nr:LuxR C-terminal-related transcriptional regulator [Nonomuraea mesophila]TDE59529.1 LuxR family transcriptional regulator [Nonomuraea mesophila]
MSELPRHNLPAEPNRFVGRERDIDELCRVVGETRVVTLCGAGGIGKTRLALRVAAGLHSFYPGGVRLAELAGAGRPEHVERELARVLGVPEEPGRPPLDTVAAVAARLRDRPCLLLLDNCEHLVERCAEVVAALIAACPALSVMATSREPLRIAGELVWRVSPLGLPPATGRPDAESVRLFLDRAAAAGTRLGPDSLPDVARLCRALDGLPLAIELAAARTSLLSPGQIADRADDRFALLTTGGRTAPARQRTLLATVEWSHDLLSAKEQVLLRRLAVFAGAFDLDLAEQVCAQPPIAEAEIVDLLGGLVDKSLVSCDEGRVRYWLLETIKQYAAERLGTAGEREPLRERHLNVLCDVQERLFATELVEPGVPWEDRLEALAASRSLAGDQRLALGWAAGSGRAGPGLRLCTAGTALLPVGGNPEEIVTWTERLLALDLSEVPGEQVARAEACLAYGLEARDELGRSLEVAGRSLTGAAPGDGFTRCVAHSVMVVVLLRMGRAGEALPHAQECLELATRSGCAWNQAAGLAGLSAVALAGGRLREAQRHGEEALARAYEHGHRWIMARTAAQLGSVAEARGDLVSARSHYEMAVGWLRELGGDLELARCLARIGRVAALAHEFGVARERLAASRALAAETGRRQGMARCLAGLSVLAECEGDLAGAVLTAAAAAALRDSIGQHSATTRIEELLGRARAGLGEGRTTSLWSRGRAMDPDDAARHVLDGGRLPDRAPVAAESVRHSLLTAREQEVAGLLTRGLSNRAIAEELVISPATVARHIANIMEKLGYTSRAQIAVWAAEHPKASA